MRKVQSKTLFSIKENYELILEFSVSYSSCGPILFNFFSLGGGWERTRKKKKVKLILLLERHLRASALLLVRLQVCKQYVEYNR